MDDETFYGIEMLKAYEMGVKELYKVIKENTTYVDNINLSDIEDIIVSCHKDIIILLKNKKVYLNGIEKYENIKKLVFMTGITILAITENNQILTVIGSDNNTRYMTNNNYKYKKIFINPLLVVALTYEKEVKIYGTIVEFAINYKNFYDVDDIAYIEEIDDIVVLKDNKIISLLNNTEYYDVDLILDGRGENYQFL